MVLLPSLDVLEALFSNSKSAVNRKVFSALYNHSVDLCFTKKMIEHIEGSISNRDFFQSLIKELADEKRLKIEKTTEKNSLDEEFIEIAKNAKIPLLLPIVLSDEKKHSSKIEFLIVVNDSRPVNKNWIALEILTKNICNVSYQDFKTNDEVNSFFSMIFSIPKYITRVSIFDREQNTDLLSKLKGKHIQFYTLLKSGNSNEYLRKETKKNLRMKLGGKLELFYTSNPRILHERKIIFESIIITVDNSHGNLVVSEPTWEIIITFNKEKASNWQKKCSHFNQVLG